MPPGGLWRGSAAILLAGFLAWPAPASSQAGADPTYRLGPQDEIQVEVVEDPALNVQRRVSGSGTVIMPLIGEVDVQGVTAEEARVLIETALELDYLRQATVNVVVLETRSQPISVIGGVQKPGTIFLGGDWRLSEALAAAGGVTESSRGMAEVRRESSIGLSDRLEVDLIALLREGDESLDIPIFVGDVIRVEVGTDITVYFLGEIGSQGAITIKGTERATLLTAIARAGGLTDRAASKLVIRRTRPGAEPLEIVANFRRILAGTDPDLELQDGDLIVVKEAFL